MPKTEIWNNLLETNNNENKIIVNQFIFYQQFDQLFYYQFCYFFTTYLINCSIKQYKIKKYNIKVYFYLSRYPK